MSDPASATIAFRMPALWTRGMTWGVLALIVVSALTLVASGRLNDPGFIRFMAIYLATVYAIMAVVIFLARFNLRRKGGVPPMRFMADYLEMPMSAATRRVTHVAYADILSLTAAGRRNKTLSLILDTRKRAHVYPLAAFADPDVAETQIRDLLREHVIAGVDGMAQWRAMEQRRETAIRFRAYRPIATWGLLAAIGVGFLLELVTGAAGDTAGMAAMGANASYLSFHGDWFRLVTANLLHANFWHLFNNALFALIFGTLVERQLGTARYAVIVLVTGILSQITSAAYADLTGRFVYSVGVSGALMGILGAQGVLNWRFGAQLPGGYRLAARFWIVMGVLQFVAVPLVVPQVDNAAHVGGLVSGAALCWLLCRGRGDIAGLRESPLVNGAAAVLGAVWVVAIAIAAYEAHDPGIRQAREVAMMQYALTSPRPNAVLDNEVAWGIAIRPDATPEQLETARALATRAVEAASASAKTSFLDTLATVEYRLGDLESAIAREVPLFSPPNHPYASQLARFLDRYLQDHGSARIVGGPVALPEVSVTLGEGDSTIHVALKEPLPNGAHIYALVRQGVQLVGIIRLTVPPGDAGETEMLPTRNPLSRPVLAQAIQRGGNIVVAMVDATDCECSRPSRQYVPFDPKVAKWP